jgi:hypothetical protein
MIIDFRQISGPKSSKQDNFEELCSQLVLREYPEAKSIDGRGGDAGLDIYEGVSPSQPQVVWQAKLFYEPIKQPQKRQIRDSFQKVANMPSLTRWILCLPRNLNPSEEKWLQSLTSTCLGLSDQVSPVSIAWWGDSKLRELLLRHQDIAKEFFPRLMEQQDVQTRIVQEICEIAASLHEDMGNHVFKANQKLAILRNKHREIVLKLGQLERINRRDVEKLEEALRQVVPDSESLDHAFRQYYDRLKRVLM